MAETAAQSCRWRWGWVALAAVALMAVIAVLAALYDREKGRARQASRVPTVRALEVALGRVKLGPEWLGPVSAEMSRPQSVLAAAARQENVRPSPVQPKPKGGSLRAALRLRSTFYPITTYESEGAARFNPTWIPFPANVYLMRRDPLPGADSGGVGSGTRGSGSEGPSTRGSGYDSVDGGRFGVDHEPRPVQLSFRGQPYDDPIRMETDSADTPVIEDMRYIATWRGTHYLSSTTWAQGRNTFAVLTYHTKTRTLNLEQYLPSPRSRAHEKNWLWWLDEEASEAAEAPVFRILYSFDPELIEFRWRWGEPRMKETRRTPIRWPSDDETDELAAPEFAASEFRGAALWTWPDGTRGLLVHARSAARYRYAVAQLAADGRVLRTWRAPPAVQRSFRIMFVLSAYYDAETDSVALTAGLEDQLACLFVHDRALLMPGPEDETAVSVSRRPG